MRRDLFLVGVHFYEGTPCKRCGGTRRYTSGGHCVECMKNGAAARAKGEKLKPIIPFSKMRKRIDEKLEQIRLERELDI